MIINQFNSIWDAFMFKEDMNTKISWEELVTELSIHHEVAVKEDCQLFNLWEFNPNGTQSKKRPMPESVGRNADNALYLHGLVADVDDYYSIEEAIVKYKELEFFLYTTFSHTQAKNKFRMVFPFEQKISYEDYLGRKIELNKFFHSIDKCSFAPSHSFYWYSSKEDNIACRNKGRFLNPLWFEVTEKPVPKEPSNRSFTGDSSKYKKMMKEQLSKCSNVRYPEGLLLASLCKSAEFTFEEFNSLAFRVAGQDSALKQPEKRKLVWDDSENSGITKERREMFFEEHGVPKTPTMDERLEHKMAEYKRKMYDGFINTKRTI